MRRVQRSGATVSTKPNDATPRPRMIEAAQHAANTIDDLVSAGGNARSVSFALANLIAVALNEQHAAGQGEPFTCYCVECGKRFRNSDWPQYEEWQHEDCGGLVRKLPASDPRAFEPMECCGRERDKDGGPNPHCECPAPRERAAESKPEPPWVAGDSPAARFARGESDWDPVEQEFRGRAPVAEPLSPIVAEPTTDRALLLSQVRALKPLVRSLMGSAQVATLEDVEAFLVGVVPLPVAGEPLTERYCCTLCSWQGTAGECPNCKGDRGLVRYVPIAQLFTAQSALEQANARVKEVEAERKYWEEQAERWQKSSNRNHADCLKAESALTEANARAALQQERADGTAATNAEYEQGLRETIRDRDAIIVQRDEANARADRLEAQLRTAVDDCAFAVSGRKEANARIELLIKQKQCTQCLAKLEPAPSQSLQDAQPVEREILVGSTWRSRNGKEHTVTSVTDKRYCIQFGDDWDCSIEYVHANLTWLSDPPAQPVEAAVPSQSPKLAGEPVEQQRAIVMGSTWRQNMPPGIHIEVRTVGPAGVCYRWSRGNTETASEIEFRLWFEHVSDPPATPEPVGIPLCAESNRIVNELMAEPVTGEKS